MPEEPEDQNEEQAAEPTPPPGWQRRWQAPTLLIAAGALLLGLVYTVKTRPDPDFTPVIDQAERLIDRQEFSSAIDLLNGRVYPWIADNADTVPAEDRLRYHLLLGRAIFLGQQEIGLDDDRNHAAVTTELIEAEQHGAVLSPREHWMLASSYASRREFELALSRAELIDDSQRGLRDKIRMQVVDAWLGLSRPRDDDALAMLATMVVEPDLPIEVRVWAVDRQARVRLRQGDYQEAILRLLRAMPRLVDADQTDLAGLHLLLGRAYLADGAIAEASGQLDRADKLMPTGAGARGAVVLLQARVNENRGELVEARDRYQLIVENYEASEAYLPAMLGLAEVESALGEPTRSTDTYERLIDAMAIAGTPEPTPLSVATSLLARFRGRMEMSDFPLAMRLADLAAKPFDLDSTPAEVLEAIAIGHRSRAEELIGGDGKALDAIRRLDAATRAEAQRHMLQAASYYRMHADRFVLTDTTRYARSLWHAADLFDLAGDREQAIRAFREFDEGLPGDVRHTESRFRLGEAFRASGEHELAAAIYKALIEESREGDPTIGPFAPRSYVPLAQAYLHDSNPDNDAEAEELLQAAVTGEVGLTGTPFFHDALIELAGVFVRSGRYGLAVERFTEAVSRYPDDPEILSLRYQLADAHRLVATKLNASLDEPMPESERRAIKAQVAEHRVAAAGLFAAVRDSYEALPFNKLGLLDRMQLRNSYFYLGDCVFDLGDLSAAIKHYDAARERFSNDPASLVAMVQIVNAHLELGDIRRARTANERARRFYLSLPATVWDDPTLPMDRDDWQRWLDSSTSLFQVADGMSE